MVKKIKFLMLADYKVQCKNRYFKMLNTIFFNMFDVNTPTKWCP